MRTNPTLLLAFLCTGALAACGQNEPAPADAVPELGVGDLDDQGVKADGWGAALNCKAIPDVPALTNPEIVISLDGLTLHLRDRGGSYDRVFPIGPGAIDDKTGLSLTPTSTGTTGATFYTSSDTREVGDTGWGYYYPCKIWWQDPETKAKKPVFAGLPFIRLVGPPTAAYAIHGPVDAFSLPAGGLLRRGFVSHGCTRMAATDIVEVYARIHRKGRVPVRIQKEVERDALGRAVDLADKWIGQECLQDADCNYDGGRCRTNPYGRSFCSKACKGSCPDKAGFVTTRCVPDGAGAGMCAVAADKVNNLCANLDGRVSRQTPLFGRTGPTNACLPGPRGRAFSACRADSECGAGNLCQPSGLASGPGFCTSACGTTCPGNATVCATVGGAGRCVPTCWGQDVCGVGLACDDGVARRSGGTARACMPGD